MLSWRCLIVRFTTSIVNNLILCMVSFLCRWILSNKQRTHVWSRNMLSWIGGVSFKGDHTPSDSLAKAKWLQFVHGRSTLLKPWTIWNMDMEWHGHILTSSCSLDLDWRRSSCCSYSVEFDISNGVVSLFHHTTCKPLIDLIVCSWVGIAVLSLMTPEDNWDCLRTPTMEICNNNSYLIDWSCSSYSSEIWIQEK